MQFIDRIYAKYWIFVIYLVEKRILRIHISIKNLRRYSRSWVYAYDFPYDITELMMIY